MHGVVNSLPESEPAVTLPKTRRIFGNMPIRNNIRHWQERVYSVLDMHGVVNALIESEPAADVAQTKKFFWQHANKNMDDSLQCHLLPVLTQPQSHIQWQPYESLSPKANTTIQDTSKLGPKDITSTNMMAKIEHEVPRSITCNTTASDAPRRIKEGAVDVTLNSIMIQSFLTNHIYRLGWLNLHHANPKVVCQFSERSSRRASDNSTQSDHPYSKKRKCSIYVDSRDASKARQQHHNHEKHAEQFLHPSHILNKLLYPLDSNGGYGC
ncbi:Fe-S cluster assembly factor, chloroplastic [Senna tora]|uniref:Fe-S cluster assembly factor, chloroplastic n=1 Tax=Senna tora TaxID=362788 RepID=A0A835CE65_9FABA|nr:Fe-S cluster assembly factor, chloroplastic [Senna tora]